MYQFSVWCFLCASDNNVEVEISSLSTAEKENIGQFSLINFTLQGVPSRICRSCHGFLVEYEGRKERYSRAEQMFLELLRIRKQPVDIEEIRKKHDLVDIPFRPMTEIFEISAVESEELFDVIGQVVGEEIHENYEEVQTISPQNKEKSPKIIEKSPKIIEKSPKIIEKSPKRIEISPRKIEKSIQKVQKSPQKIEKLPKPVVIEKLNPPPKLLNPTIVPNFFQTTRIELFRCDYCSHTTSTKPAMERHMKQIHLRRRTKIIYTCKVCSRTFAKAAVLKIHEKIHLIQRPTFECQQCGKVLSSQTAVSNHIKWLHSEKQFECKVCDKKFATNGAKNEHEKTHSAVKTHVCPICQKSFKTASTLTQHIDTHGETSYNCPECNLRLNSKRTLKQHMLKHSDVVRFTCEICQAQFKRLKAFKEHLISQHTDIKAYKCEWCDRTFANGANSRKHQKDCHPKELAEAERTNEKKSVNLPKIEELLSMTLEGAQKINETYKIYDEVIRSTHINTSLLFL